jgi:hypothetical protein
MKMNEIAIVDISGGDTAISFRKTVTQDIGYWGGKQA